MYYTLILTILSLDTLIKARACSTHYTVPYPVTNRVPLEISRNPGQFYGVNRPDPVNIIIKSEHAYPPSPHHAQDGPIEKRKLLSSFLTLPGMLADKLVSGEIAV